MGAHNRPGRVRDRLAAPVRFATVSHEGPLNPCQSTFNIPMSLDDVVEWINARRVDPQNTRFDGRKQIGGGLSGLGRRRNLMLQRGPSS